MDAPTARRATPQDAPVVARLLHDFNTEFAAPSPGPEVLAARLRSLLATDTTTAIIAGEPAVALALLTYRSNVWFEGPVVLLDELYVVPGLRGRGIGSAVVELLVAEARERGAGLIEVNVDEPDVDAQRFYRRHGFTPSEPGSTDRAFYLWRDPWVSG